MPDLLKGSSPLEIRYIVSLPYSLLSTVSLLCAFPEFEGLGDWLGEARRQLPPSLMAELCLLVTFPGGRQRFTTELAARLTPESHFEGMMAQFQAIPSADYCHMALKALGRASTPPLAPADLEVLLDRPAEWAAHLDSIGSQAAPARVAALVRDGQRLKARLLTALEQFWQEVYAREFEATQYLMARSVAYHLSRPYIPSFQELFVEVTGRRMPERVAEFLPSIKAVTFVPSCYVGPYVAYIDLAEHLILFYNCRATPTNPTAVDGASLYPPLKALSDETRLEIMTLLRGKELYSQELVEQLDISQPAVSRHLNLMAAAGVLKIRRQGNTKYYSIDTETLSRLSDALRALG